MSTEKRLSDLEALTNGLLSEVSTLKAELAAKDEQIEKLTASVKALRAAVSDEVNELSQRVGSVTGELSGVAERTEQALAFLKDGIPVRIISGAVVAPELAEGQRAAAPTAEAAPAGGFTGPDGRAVTQRSGKTRVPRGAAPLNSGWSDSRTDGK